MAVALCAAFTSICAPAQGPEGNRIEELKQRAERLQRELETYRSWRAQGGIAQRIQRSLRQRTLRPRVAEAGESQLPITGRTRARQLSFEELQTLANDVVVVLGKEVILQRRLDPLLAYLASYPREDSELEQGRRAMLELLKGALVRDMFPAPTAAARKLAKQVHDRAAAGASFAELAKAHSRGPGAEDGGHVGWVTRGTPLGLQIEAKVFELEEGDTSTPIATPLGFAMVRVTDIEPATDDTPERRAVRMILVPYVDELEEIEQVGGQIEAGQVTLKYRTNDILPLLPAQYR